MPNTKPHWLTPPPDELPDAAGAYILEFICDGRSIEVGALGELDLPSGRLRYYGSAHGPGGLKARIERHLRDDGALHWHVDYLAAELDITRVAYSTELGECDLLQLDLDADDWHAPIPGFGASDCTTCPAHLLARRS
jgi:Uri superfamily endonuclease